MRRGLTLVVLLVGAAVAVVSGTAAARLPNIAVVDRSPLTVRGSGFIARERVTVTVIVGVRRVRTTAADGRGRFVVRFPGITIDDRCTSYTLRALGSRGSKVTLKVTAVCQEPTEPAGLQPIDR